MAHEIHIGHVLAYLLLFEGAAFLLPAVIMFAKWTRYYRDPSRGWDHLGGFKSAWGVVFHSEVRLELYGWIITLNGAGLVVFVLWLIARWMGLSLAW